MRANLTRRYADLLGKAERLARTDLSYLLKGGSWLVLGQISISVLAFLVSIAFARYVPKEAYGTYRFLISIFWSLTAFGLSGIPVTLVRAVARGDASAYRKSLTLSLIGSVPMALGSIGFTIYYLVQENLQLAIGCGIIALIGPFMQSAYLYGAFLEGKKAFRQNALSGIVLNLVPTLALGAFMFFTDSPLAFLAAYLGTSVLTGAAISLVVVRALGTKTSAIETDDLRSLGLHMSAMNILFTISQQADKLLVFHSLGPVSLAVYSFAVSIPDQLKAVVGNLETLAFPKFAQRKVEEILPTLGRRLFGFTALVTLLVVAYIVAAPYIFALVFPAYMESVFFSQLYALSLIPVGSVVPVSILQSHAAKRELYIFNTVIPIFQIASLAIGITIFGLMGAIVARIIARVMTLLLSLILLKSYSKRVI